MRDDQTLDAEVKARVPRSHKRKLSKLARAQHVKPSHLIRESVREMIERAEAREKELAAA